MRYKNTHTERHTDTNTHADSKIEYIILTERRWQKHSMVLIIFVAFSHVFSLIIAIIVIVTIHSFSLYLHLHLVRRVNAVCATVSVCLCVCAVLLYFVVVLFLWDHFMLSHPIHFAIEIYANANKGSHNKLLCTSHSYWSIFILLFTRKRMRTSNFLKVKAILLSLMVLIAGEKL